MRKIGTLPNEELGSRLVDYLLTEGIRSKAEREDDDQWVLWINHEDQIDEASKVLAHFNESYDDPRYLGRAAGARAVRVEDRKRQEFARRNNRTGAQIWGRGPSATARKAPITFGLIAVCVVVAVWAGLGGDSENFDKLSFVSQKHAMADEGWDMTDATDASVDVLAGEYWRVLTPNLLHLGPIHLLFNMMWLHSLGGQIESRKGAFTLIAIVLACGIASSLCQVYIARYPFFGGMSGVVYGLFGYVWMKSRFDPSDGLMISQQNIRLMIVWFAICFLPGFGVANGGHAGGLIAGVIIGYVSAQNRV